MNYKKQYDKIIDCAKQCIRVKHKGIYYELHHIIPKCVGGSEEIENKVLLTAKEHFACHKLLCKIYPNERGIYFAFKMMCWGGSNKHERDYRVSARDYQLLRELKSFNANFGKDNGMFGVKRSRELIDKMTKCRIEANKKRTFNRIVDNIIHPNVKIERCKGLDDEEYVAYKERKRVEWNEGMKDYRHKKGISKRYSIKQIKEPKRKWNRTSKEYKEYHKMRTKEAMQKPEVRRRMFEGIERYKLKS